MVTNFFFGRNPCKTRTGTHYAFAGSNLYFPMHSVCGIVLRRLFPGRARIVRETRVQQGPIRTEGKPRITT